MRLQDLPRRNLPLADLFRYGAGGGKIQFLLICHVRRLLSW